MAVMYSSCVYALQRGDQPVSEAQTHPPFISGCVPEIAGGQPRVLVVVMLVVPTLIWGCCTAIPSRRPCCRICLA